MLSVVSSKLLNHFCGFTAFCPCGASPSLSLCFNPEKEWQNERLDRSYVVTDSKLYWCYREGNDHLSGLKLIEGQVNANGETTGAFKTGK